MAHNTSYSKLLLTKEWRIKKKSVEERDLHKCRNCGNAEKLEVHHRQYHVNANTGFLRLPWDYDNKYLVTLCSQCHEAGHKKFKIPSFKN